MSASHSLSPVAVSPTGAIFRSCKPLLPVLVFCVVLIAIGGTLSPVFLSPFNLGNLAVQIMPLLLVAIGQSYAVGSGGLDLSVGSIVSVAAVVAALSFAPFGVAPALVLAMGVALAIGALNGLFVSRGIEPFLVTLGTLSLGQGIALFISPVPGGTVPSGFRQIAGYWGPVPTMLPMILAFAAVAIWSVRRTRTGANIVAVGGNREVAHLCGIPVRWTLIKAYLICAVFAALAAFLLVARTGTGDPTIGARFTLDSLAAVVLGGTLLGGGRVVMAGTVLGAIALGLLSNILNLLQVPAFYQTPVKGLLVIGAVLVPSVFARIVEHRKALRLAAAFRAQSRGISA
jgi:ribose transport system permease protein